MPKPISTCPPGQNGTLSTEDRDARPSSVSESSEGSPGTGEGVIKAGTCFPPDLAGNGEDESEANEEFPQLGGIT